MVRAGTVCAEPGRPVAQGRASGVRVGEAEDQRRIVRADAFERGEQRSRLGRRVAVERDRMPADDDDRRRAVQAEVARDRLGLHERCSAQVVERRRPDVMHAPRGLAHRDHAPRRGLCRCEVHVREHRQRVPHGVIDGALAHVAALDVRDRDAQRQGRGRGRQHLVTVGRDDEHVGPAPVEHVRESERRGADRARHRRVLVARIEAREAFGDREALSLDHVDRVAEVGRQVGSGHEQPRVHRVEPRQLAQHPVQVAPVGAGRRHDVDRA